MITTKGLIGLLSIGLMTSCLTATGASDKPIRAHDLVYGESLFEYYQGNAFEALSLLNVAKQKGGIKGHGDHPSLVEGGLLLSYGMTLEAKAIFENLLEEKLSIEDQNLAWFYLGKVFYLENNFEQALESFAKIRLNNLKQDAPERFYELVYLKGQMAAQSRASDTSWRTALPEKHVFHYYLRYNEAVLLLEQADNNAAITAFKHVISLLEKHRINGKWQALYKHSPEEAGDIMQEVKAIYSLSLLSLGQLYLHQKNYEHAFDALKKIDRKSAFSDQALFYYAIAASQLERYPLALSALNKLNSKSLFNPWQQQTPYALAYLYEQLKEPVLALEAYRAAVAQYETLQNKLTEQRAGLSEEVLLSALNLKETIGSDSVVKDAYGRLQTPKNQFDFSKLLAGEQFQRQLSELHELYLLQNSLQRWRKQLDSFEDMLDTRLLSRQQKIAATRVELANQDVASWTEKESQFTQKIEAALASEDAYFFMTEDQLSYFNRLEKVQERLRLLPDDHKKKAQFQTKYLRAKAYFDWWINDEYAVNRWRTLKALKELQAQMTLFRQQYAVLNAQEEMDESHVNFAERVRSGHERLIFLQAELDKSIVISSQTLLAQVDSAMQSQLDEIAKYLLVSREALARVSDRLLVEGKIAYENQNSTTSSTPPVEQEAAQ